MSIILKKAAVLKAEPIGNDGYDPIVTFASQIEKIESRVKTEEIIRNLTEESEANKYKIGGALARIQANESWWREAGYQNFKDYVETSLGIGYRKAMYMIEIYKKLLELDVPLAKFSGIGWAKINRIVSVLTNENIDEWVEKAKVMSRRELEACIKAEKAKAIAGPSAEASATPKTITNKNFKLHGDQRELWDDAYAKFREETGKEGETTALEGICAHYLGGGGVAFSDLKQHIEYASKHSDDPALFIGTTIKILEEIYPDWGINLQLDPPSTKKSTSEGLAAAI